MVVWWSRNMRGVKTALALLHSHRYDQVSAVLMIIVQFASNTMILVPSLVVTILETIYAQRFVVGDPVAVGQWTAFSGAMWRLAIALITMGVVFGGFSTASAVWFIWKFRSAFHRKPWAVYFKVFQFVLVIIMFVNSVVAGIFDVVCKDYQFLSKFGGSYLYMAVLLGASGPADVLVKLPHMSNDTSMIGAFGEFVQAAKHPSVRSLYRLGDLTDASPVAVAVNLLRSSEQCSFIGRVTVGIKISFQLITFATTLITMGTLLRVVSAVHDERKPKADPTERPLIADDY